MVRSSGLADGGCVDITSWIVIVNQCLFPDTVLHHPMSWLDE